MDYILRTTFVLLFLLFSSTFVICAETSLWISRCKPGERYCDTEELVRYDFAGWKIVGSEIVYSSVKGDIGFWNAPRIIDESYLVTGSGNILDLETRKVLFRNNGWLRMIRKNKVVIESHKMDEGYRLYSFDLRTKGYERIDTERNVAFPADAVFSSDGNIAASWVGFGPNAGITFSKVDERFTFRTLKKVPGQFSTYCDVTCSSTAHLPIVWIDDNTVLTQRINGELITINTAGIIKTVVKIPASETTYSFPVLRCDEHGNFFYTIDDNTHVVDIGGKKLSKGPLPLGNGFSRINGGDFEYEYYFNGKPIGGVRSSAYVMSTRDHLAVVYAPPGEYFSDAAGIKVWSAADRKWTTIEVRNANLIGWTGNN